MPNYSLTLPQSSRCRPSVGKKEKDNHLSSRQTKKSSKSSFEQTERGRSVWFSFFHRDVHHPITPSVPSVKRHHARLGSPATRPTCRGGGRLGGSARFQSGPRRGLIGMWGETWRGGKREGETTPEPSRDLVASK